MTDIDGADYARAWRAYLGGEQAEGVNAVNRFALALIRRHALGRSILELGCGPGTFLEACAAPSGAENGFSPSRYLGVDVNPHLLAHARRFAGPDVAFERADICAETGDSFDLDAMLAARAPELLLAVRLLNNLEDACVERLFGALARRRGLRFLFVLPYVAEVEGEGADAPSTAECAFCGASVTHHQRPITWYRARLERLADGPVRLDLGELRQPGAPSHYGLSGAT